jgi:hypothetical protein
LCKFQICCHEPGQLKSLCWYIKLTLSSTGRMMVLIKFLKFYLTLIQFFTKYHLQFMLTLSGIIMITPKVHTNRRNAPQPEDIESHICRSTPKVHWDLARGMVGEGGGALVRVPALLPPNFSYLPVLHKQLIL